LGPAVVVCSFDVPAGVFAFDDAGVCSEPPGGQDSADEFADRVGPEPGDGVSGLRGKSAGHSDS